MAEFLSLLVVGPVLLGGFIALSHTAFIAGPVQLASSLPLLNRLMSLGVHIAPYLMVTTLFTFLYMYHSQHARALLPALIGAVVAGVLWAAVGIIFTRFVEYSSRLTLVYAGFAAVIAVVMWTYFGWLILLSGAQLSFYIQNPSYLRFGLRQLHLSAAELEQLALTISFLVAHNAGTGRPRYTLDALATDLGVTASRCAAGHRTGAGARAEVRRRGLLLARDPSHLAIIDIIEAARHQHSGKPVSRALAIPGVESDGRAGRCGTAGQLCRAHAARSAADQGRCNSPIRPTGETGALAAPPAAATRRQSSDRQ